MLVFHMLCRITQTSKVHRTESVTPRCPVLHNIAQTEYVLCGLLTIEHAWSRGPATSSVTAVLPPPGQRCGTVCLNNFGNWISPLDNLNDRWKCLCFVSWATAPCVWTLRLPTNYLLTYYLQTTKNNIPVSESTFSRSSFVLLQNKTKTNSGTKKL